MDVKENLIVVKNNIKEAQKTCGREAEDVKLMAVSKFHTIDEIRRALEGGQLLFGENRVQEANEKFSILKEENPQIKLHIIGQLQCNKVKTAVKIADCIQSVDRPELMNEIEKQCSKIEKKIEVLFEFHTGEESKSGFETEEELISVIEDCANGKYPHIIPKGFMTMAPFTDDESLIRKSFVTLRNLSDKIKKMYPQFELNELSMGMSADYKIAIQEGATLVRVGTAIFGERDYTKK